MLFIRASGCDHCFSQPWPAVILASVFNSFSAFTVCALHKPPSAPLVRPPQPWKRVPSLFVLTIAMVDICDVAPISPCGPNPCLHSITCPQRSCQAKPKENTHYCTMAKSLPKIRASFLPSLNLKVRIACSGTGSWWPLVKSGLFCSASNHVPTCPNRNQEHTSARLWISHWMCSFALLSVALPNTDATVVLIFER